MVKIKENEIFTRNYILTTYLIAVLISLQVLQLLSQLRKEFNVSRDEHVLPLLERFHHGHRLVLQLLEESLKGVVQPEAKLKIPTITHTTASDSESGDVSANEEAGASDTDVFDTVTQLDETGNAIVCHVSHSALITVACRFLLDRLPEVFIFRQRPCYLGRPAL